MASAVTWSNQPSELRPPLHLLSRAFLDLPNLRLIFGIRCRTFAKIEVHMPPIFSTPRPRPRPSAFTLQPTTYNPFTANNIRVCPECAGQVIQNCGCTSCRQCGWGKCG